MLLEGGIGDAYGAGFEFASRIKIKRFNKVNRYMRHPLHRNIFKKYTDDTQMAIAIAELLLAKQEWTKLDVANKFVEVFKRDRRKGYARRFYGLLKKVKSGKDLLDQIIPKSERNGAAMRAYSLGILSDESEILEKARLQASVTHDTPKGILSAQAIALMNHYFIYQKGEKTKITTYLSDIQSCSWAGKWRGKVAIDAIQTVEAVLTILQQESTLKDILKSSVDFGGDVDTVASLALAIASTNDNFEKNLPEFLFDELENKAYGRDYLSSLDKRLEQSYLS